MPSITFNAPSLCAWKPIYSITSTIHTKCSVLYNCVFVRLVVELSSEQSVRTQLAATCESAERARAELEGALHEAQRELEQTQERASTFARQVDELRTKHERELHEHTHELHARVAALEAEIAEKAKVGYRNSSKSTPNAAAAPKFCVYSYKYCTVYGL